MRRWLPRCGSRRLAWSRSGPGCSRKPHSPGSSPRRGSKRPGRRGWRRSRPCPRRAGRRRRRSAGRRRADRARSRSPASTTAPSGWTQVPCSSLGWSIADGAGSRPSISAPAVVRPVWNRVQMTGKGPLCARHAGCLLKRNQRGGLGRSGGTGRARVGGGGRAGTVRAAREEGRDHVRPVGRRPRPGVRVVESCRAARGRGSASPPRRRSRAAARTPGPAGGAGRSASGAR